MAALAQVDPLAALDRVQHAYVHGQCYEARPTPPEVSAVCRRIAAAARGEGALRWRPGVTLSIVTARARGPLQARESKLAFGRAVLSNAIARSRLAGYLERVVFHAGTGPSVFDGAAFDDFGLVRVAARCTRTPRTPCWPPARFRCWRPRCATSRRAARTVLGRGTDRLPPAAALPRTGPAERIVLYPHFNDFVTPGWLDKHLPWRRSPRAHPWLDDMLLVAPSPAFLATLPNGKLPDRQDFYRYGPDHAGRIRAWETAIAECGRFAEAVLAWMERPDPTLIEPI